MISSAKLCIAVEKLRGPYRRLDGGGRLEATRAC